MRLKLITANSNVTIIRLQPDFFTNTRTTDVRGNRIFVTVAQKAEDLAVMHKAVKMILHRGESFVFEKVLGKAHSDNGKLIPKDDVVRKRTKLFKEKYKKVAFKFSYSNFASLIPAEIPHF